MGNREAGRVSRLHGVCKVCRVSQPRGLIRPLPASIEMRVADALSDEGDMGRRPAYVYVCRECWLKFISKMSKGEMIAVLEAVSCDLQEVHRVLCEKMGSRVDNIPGDGLIPDAVDIPF